ncbi:MAG: hypothetical protein HY711_04365, partial [Candidatus Melainabacteria bacterium]|nr:hypothetical protein [Candidatus Melainabacteria bacterium]
MNDFNPANGKHTVMDVPTESKAPFSNYSLLRRGLDLISAGQVHVGDEELKYHRSLGLNYLSKGDYQLALQELNKCVCLGSQDSQSFHYRGLAFAGQGNPIRALEDYGKALSLDGSNLAVYLSRANT